MNRFKIGEILIGLSAIESLNIRPTFKKRSSGYWGKEKWTAKKEKTSHGNDVDGLHLGQPK